MKKRLRNLPLRASFVLYALAALLLSFGCCLLLLQFLSEIQRIFYPRYEELLSVLFGLLQFLTVPLTFGGGMILCAIVFYRKKLKLPISLLTDAYRKVADNDLNFSLRYECTDEMGKLCAAFDKMRSALEENNREKWRQMEERKRLNAAFSHDLRTPLTVLTGHASLLLKSLPEGSVTNEEVLGEVQTMSAHITRLENYVNAMSQLQRLEDIIPRREPCSIQGLFREFEETAFILCPGRELLFRDFTGKEFVSADKELLSQVYENLLSNAGRYAQRRISVTLRTQTRFFVLCVQDDGVGFSEEALENAAKPFYRGSPEDDGVHMGLGLNICRILCVKHGGSLTIANAEQGGACITALFACDPD